MYDTSVKEVATPKAGAGDSGSEEMVMVTKETIPEFTTISLPVITIARMESIRS